MPLDKELEKMSFDTRLIDWNLRHKKIKEEDLKKHMASLPDCGSNVEAFQIESEGTVASK